tara:strand:+ start:295 stop:489 length:195 start_codon:yes stop_codon:yes gene_type:complete
MAKYFYKKDKRVKRLEDNASTTQINQLNQDGYVQVSDRRNPENTIISKPKPKPKKKYKKKSKKK